MSREERRAYQRQMKSMDRGAGLPPAARARAERNAARRALRASTTRPGEFTTRFWIRSTLVALAAGFIGFSLRWENGNGMPAAVYVGLAVGAVVLLLLVGFRYLQRRAAAT
jgi:hypothetical protein